MSILYVPGVLNLTLIIDIFVLQNRILIILKPNVPLYRNLSINLYGEDDDWLLCYWNILIANSLTKQLYNYEVLTFDKINSDKFYLDVM